MVVRRRRVVGWFVAVVLVATVMATSASASAAGKPADAIPAGAVSPSQVAPGSSVFVSGSQWPPNTEISVQICGEEARHGSGDCDLPSSTIVGTDSGGVFGTRVMVQVPPKPCPCVVEITALGGDDRGLALPITIDGAPSVPLPPLVPEKTVHPLTVEDAELIGGSWSAWFGWPAERTLVLRVRNTSGAPVNDPLLLVAAGRGSHPTEPQDVPVQRPFATGEVRTVRVPATFAAPSIGGYSVRYRIGADGTTATKRLETSSWPWGLFLVALLLLQGVLLLVRNRVRSRVAPEESAPPESPSLDAENATVAAAPNANGIAPDDGAPEPISWRMSEAESASRSD